MRKVIGFCGAAVVAAAGTVYLTADYAAHHPDSAVASCAVAGYRLGTEYNPLYRIGCAIREHACGTVQDSASAQPGPNTEPQSIDLARTGPGPTECTEMLQSTETRLEPRIVIEEEIERLVVPRAAEEESEEPARAMPPAEDHAPPAPQIMPYADGVQPVRGSTEEPEPKGFGGLPDCREDPGHSLLVPGCPLLETSPSTTVTEPTKKVVPSPIHLQVDPAALNSLFPLGQIDTLELRRSDLKPYKGEPVPF
jgi:hypothetical protein